MPELGNDYEKNLFGYLVDEDYFSSVGSGANTTSNSDFSNILDPSQYDISFTESTNLSIEILDEDILNTYFFPNLGIRLFNQDGSTLYNVVYQLPLSQAQSAVYVPVGSGQVVNIQITFITSDGMKIIEEQMTAP